MLALVDKSGHSFVFSESSSLREKAAASWVSGNRGTGEKEKAKKGKAKAFVLDDMLDSLDLKLQKKYDANKKMCQDLLKEIADAIQKEPECNRSKMSRITQQLVSRGIVVRALLIDFDDENKAGKTYDDVDWDFADAVPDIDADTLRAIAQYGKAKHKLELKAVIHLLDCVRKAHSDGASHGCDMLSALTAEEEVAKDAAVQSALTSVTEAICALVERDFAAEEGSDLKLRDAELLQQVLAIHGWAGCGFSCDVDFTALAGDLACVVKVTHSKIFFECVVAHFSSTARPMMEPALLGQIIRLGAVHFRRHTQLRLQTSEEGVKNIETKCRDDMDLQVMCRS